MNGKNVTKAFEMDFQASLHIYSYNAFSNNEKFLKKKKQLNQQNWNIQKKEKETKKHITFEWNKNYWMEWQINWRCRYTWMIRMDEGFSWSRRRLVYYAKMVTTNFTAKIIKRKEEKSILSSWKLTGFVSNSTVILWLLQSNCTTKLGNYIRFF